MKVASLRFSVGESIFVALFVFASSLTWISATLLSESYERSPAIFLFGIIVSALAFAVLVLVEPTNKLLVYTGLAIGFLSAIPFAFLGGVANLAVGAPVATLAGLLGISGLWRARRINESLRKPRLVHTARRTLPLYFAGVSMVLTAIVFSSPLLADAIATPVPEPLIRFSVRMLDPILQPMLGVSVQEDIDIIIRHGIDTQLERAQAQIGESATPDSINLEEIRGLEGINLKNLPLPDGAQLGELIIDDELIARERAAYGKRLGIELDGDDDVADIVIKLIDKQAKRFEEQLQNFYKIGFFVSAFFLFQLLSLPFSWLTIGLSAITLTLLRAINVAKMEEAPMVKEQLEWKRGAGVSESVRENDDPLLGGEIRDTKNGDMR